MYRTIFIGSSVAIQGLFVRSFGDGRISVRVGSEVYTGFPAETKAA